MIDESREIGTAGLGARRREPPRGLGPALGWLARTLVLCLVVGIVLSVFDVDPVRILTDTWATLGQIHVAILRLIRWAIPYVLLGAVVVVPVALISLALRLLRR
jgi:hypothetical protein